MFNFELFSFLKLPENKPPIIAPYNVLFKGFEVIAMPTSYLIDRKGNIRHIHRGFRSGETNELRALITQLVMEHP